MKRIVLFSFAALLLCAALALPASSQSNLPTSGKEEAALSTINGHTWMASSTDNKLSFLLGVESAIAMECALSDAQAAKTNGKPAYSRFQEGWITAFGTSSRHQILQRIDGYYTSHPADKTRHVFDVIWAELILPTLPDRR